MGIAGGVNDGFLDRIHDVLGGAREAEAMIGAHQIVIDGLGNPEDLAVEIAVL